jgi:hypothetical protein
MNVGVVMNAGAVIRLLFNGLPAMESCSCDWFPGAFR